MVKPKPEMTSFSSSEPPSIPFKPSAVVSPPLLSDLPDNSSNSCEPVIVEILPNTLSSTSTASATSSQDVCDSVTIWRNLLRGPEPAPLCTGHRETCVLKTVNRAGPNKGKQFYMCAKPEGYKDDPNARCKFFKWVGKQSNAKGKKQELLP